MVNCVICLQPKLHKTTALLEAQCSVIFFLKEFLHCQSPPLNWNLNGFLIKYGNPSDWIQFCGPCSKWVEEGKRLHKLVQQLQAKLQRLHANFVDTVKRSSRDTADFDTKVDLASKNNLLFLVRTEILSQSQQRRHALNDVKNDKTEVDDVSPSWDELDALAKVKVELDTTEEEIENFEGFLPLDSDFDDDRHLDNVIYPEEYQEGRVDNIEVVPDSRSSDEDFIPEKKPKKKKSINSASQRRHNPNKRNGPMKSPVESRTCPICSIVLDKPSLLQRHVNSAHTRIQSPRPNMRKGLGVAQKMENDSQPDSHKLESSTPRKSNGRRKSPEEERTCPICSLVLDKPSLLKRHVTTVHTKIPVINCLTCGKGFTRKDSLSKHNCPNIRKDLSPAALAAAQKLKIVSELDSYSIFTTSENVPKITRLRQRTSKPTHEKKTTSDDDDKCLGDNSDTSLPPSDLDNESGDSSNSAWEKKNTLKSKRTLPCVGARSWRKSPLEVRTCPVCAVVFDRPSFLAKHLRSKYFRKDNCGIGNEGNIHSFKCPVCCKTLESKSSFSTHFQSHTKFTVEAEGSQPPAWCRKSDPSTRTCPHAECDGKVFPSPSKLKLHLVTKHKEITNEELFKCSYCPKTFVKKSYLKDHEWFHLKPDEKLSYLKNMRSKVPVKDKTCPVCKLVFLSISRMRVHLNNAHEKKNLWSCDVCLKGFTRKDSYEEHLKTHLGAEDREQLLAGVPVTVPSTQTPEKSVTLKFKVRKSGSISHRSCPKCGRVFSNRSRMSMHLKTVHEKSTATICEICGKSIGCKQTLRVHMKNHEKEPGVKDWICEDCGRAFRHRYSLKRHQFMTHNPKADMRKFPCLVPKCHKAYPFRSLLVQHQKARRHFSSAQGEGVEDNSSSSLSALPINNSIPEINPDVYPQYPSYNQPRTSFLSHFIPETHHPHPASSNWNTF